MSDPVSRRQLLVRAGTTGLAALGVTAAGVWFYRRPGWPPVRERVALPAWTVDAYDGPPMVIARGTDPGGLVAAALEEMGGMHRFVEEGDVVLVKPNAAFDRPAWQGVTAHPDVVGAVVKACRDAGASEVLVTDNPIHAAEGCFRKTGIGKATEAAGGRVVLPRPEDFAGVSLPDTLLDGWPVLLGPLARATKVIGIAPVKDHNLARVSLTLKNWYGLLGGPRNRLHQKMDETIATLGRLIRPTLSVLDGTRLLLRNGPTGGSPDDVVPGDVVAISTDPVALDAFGTTLLGRAPEDVPYLALAAEGGVGTADFAALQPREISR
ncbi:MAG: DUF362 domain-containing protein [Planctomycetota bacterium]|jgi:uncharacterized protein (DUF362 family)